MSCFHNGGVPADSWMMPSFVDSDWPPAIEHGLNGVSPWGDVNREHGTVDDGGRGVISAESQWIWSHDTDAHDDVAPGQVWDAVELLPWP